MNPTSIRIAQIFAYSLVVFVSKGISKESKISLLLSEQKP